MPGDSTEAPTGFRQRSRREPGLNSDRLDAVERAVGVIRTWMADIKRVTRPEVVLTLDDTDRHKSDDRTGKGNRSSDKGSTMTHLDKQEFLAWAYDDLLTNTTRGVLAEYIVATALGIDDEKRREWANHDLEFDGVGIEVKSAAYVQTWEQTRPSEITFSIRTAHGWDDSSKTRADNAKRSDRITVTRLDLGNGLSRPARCS